MPASDFAIVTLDGAAAAGKSTTAQAVAAILDFLYVDSGTHYRALTAVLLEKKIAPQNKAQVAAFLKHIELDTVIVGRKAVIQVQGQAFSDETLRSSKINAHVSHIAAQSAVRARLFDYQRSLAATARRKGFRGLIMEGRDIGSIIFPEAPYQFFLEADSETRARRRTRQGFKDTISTRDHIDSKRAAAPLVRPDRAILIDTAQYNQQQVVDQIIRAIQGPSPSAVSRIRCISTPVNTINRQAFRQGVPLDPYHLFYFIAAHVAQFFCDHYCRLEIHGLENIPRRGNFIIVANHTSYLDIPTVGNCYAMWRPIYYLGRKNLFFGNPLAWFLRRLSPVMVDLESDANVSAVKQILKILHSGSGLLAFPEGNRSKDGSLQAAKPGLGMIACRTQTKIIPARIFGAFEAWDRHHTWPNLRSEITLVYDQAFTIEKTAPDRLTSEDYTAATEAIMARIAAITCPETKVY